jgi:hypothetical protein
VLVLVKKPQSISQYLPSFLYNGRIGYVMAITRPDLDSNRFGSGEHLIDSIVKPDINFVAGCWAWLNNCS